jgi:small redox-active disulfide protein 2
MVSSQVMEATGILFCFIFSSSTMQPGCKNCQALKENTEAALKEAAVKAEVIKVEDLKDIMGYGVMSTPALVIDEKVVSYGKVLKPKEIVKILLNQKP